jgi:hypothetical protein
MTDTRTNMRPEGGVIGSQMRITERVIEIDLHRDRESRVVILAPDRCLHMQREQRETFLLVREIGQPFGLNAAPPLQIVEAFLCTLPALTLRSDSVALAPELLVLATERLNLDEKWRDQLAIIDGGDPPHKVRSLALYLCDPLVQCRDVRSRRIDIAQPCHLVLDHLRVGKDFFNTSPNLRVKPAGGYCSWRAPVNIAIAGVAAVVRFRFPIRDDQAIAAIASSGIARPQ